mgnify:FL=1
MIPLLTVSLILSASAILIGYGRGYRINVNKPTQINATGIISATSDPVGAQVLVDTKLKTATNNSFAISPDWYTVRIIKEGYIGWEKKVRVQGEVVTRADAYLFPTNPSLSPITTSGLLVPTLSPDGGKIAFVVPADATRDGNKKPGLYTLELSDRPLGRNRDPKFIAEGNFTPNVTLLWNPNYTEIILSDRSIATSYDLADTTRIVALSPLTLATRLADWKKETDLRNLQKLAAFKASFIDVATSSTSIISFSPDESKLLYEATAAATIPQVIVPPMIGTNPTEETRTITPGNLYVYDSKEDKNYLLLSDKEVKSLLPTPTPSPKSSRPGPPSIGLLSREAGSRFAGDIGYSIAPNGLAWFPTSRHLLLTGNGKIDVMEYDRTNWTTLYSGPFDGSFLAPWPSGSRLVILTNLNPGASTLPNLYTVNLR